MIKLIKSTFYNEIVSKREKNFKQIAQAIYSQTDKFYPMRYDHLDVCSDFAFPVICKSKKVRDESVNAYDGKIELRPIVGGDMTIQPFFSKYEKRFILTKSNARLIHEQGLYFGNNPELTEKEKNEIISVFTH
jgi:CDP-6-deoxy-D-xylo-4-hexulose-3-dehydrase